MLVKIENLAYENPLGSIILRDVQVDLEKDQVELMRSGTPIEDLDYGLIGSTIEAAEATIAFDFFAAKYHDVLTGVYEMNSEEILAIQNFLGLNKLQFAKLIGIARASLANIYKRNKCRHTVQILIIERLGMELGRRGSAKLLYDAMSRRDGITSELAAVDSESSKRMTAVRFGKAG